MSTLVGAPVKLFLLPKRNVILVILTSMKLGALSLNLLTDGNFCLSGHIVNISHLAIISVNTFLKKVNVMTE